MSHTHASVFARILWPSARHPQLDSVLAHSVQIRYMLPTTRRARDSGSPLPDTLAFRHHDDKMRRPTTRSVVFLDIVGEDIQRRWLSSSHSHSQSELRLIHPKLVRSHHNRFVARENSSLGFQSASRADPKHTHVHHPRSDDIDRYTARQPKRTRSLWRVWSRTR